MAPWYQKYRLKWPWSPTQVANTDQMFSEIYSAIGELQSDIADIVADDNTLTNSPVIIIDSQNNDESPDNLSNFSIIPGTQGTQGPQGIIGPPGMDGDDSSNLIPILPSYDIGRVTASLVLPAFPATAQNGVIFRGNTLPENRFIHDYEDPTSGVDNGKNLFIGRLAGNFTMLNSGTPSIDASWNIGIGYQALELLTIGHSNVIIGFEAGRFITTGRLNVAIGHSALRLCTTGNDNMAIGRSALTTNVSGSDNTAVGNDALNKNTASGNTAIGKSALGANIVGTENTAIGLLTLALATSSGNTAIGNEALRTATTSLLNTAVGGSALVSASTGDGRNVAVGYNSGGTMTTDNNNTAIGYNSGRSGASPISGSITIGSGVKTGNSNEVVIGSSAIVTTLLFGSVGIQVAAPTAILHLKAGTATANTAPLKFTSGTLLTTAEAGAVEFLTDAYYGTITTGAARKTFAFLESPAFTTPNIGSATGVTLSLSNTINLITTGAAPTVGQATLVGGTVTVNTTAMTATALLFLQRKTAGGTIGFSLTYTQVNNTSFTINSDSVLDTSVVNWWIVETH